MSEQIEISAAAAVGRRHYKSRDVEGQTLCGVALPAGEEWASSWDGELGVTCDACKAMRPKKGRKAKAAEEAPPPPPPPVEEPAVLIDPAQTDAIVRGLAASMLVGALKARRLPPIKPDPATGYDPAGMWIESCVGVARWAGGDWMAHPLVVFGVSSLLIGLAIRGARPIADDAALADAWGEPVG